MLINVAKLFQKLSFIDFKLVFLKFVCKTVGFIMAFFEYSVLINTCPISISYPHPCVSTAVPLFIQ